MKRISVIGWVPKSEKEMQILEDCELSLDGIRSSIKWGLFTKRSDLEVEAKRVRVTVEVDVEVLE